jgi:hypothetical protein
VRLKRFNSSFLYWLRAQQFISLVLQSDALGALDFARSHLQAYASTDFDAFKQVTALLVFRKQTRCPRYTGLLQPARWLELAAAFRKEMLNVHNLPKIPLLELQLQVCFLES